MVRLVSQSKTRAKILKEYKVEFIQSSLEFDEDRLINRYKKAKEFVYSATKEKLKRALERFSLDIPIIVADTVVSVDDEILRKAKDENEAYTILKKQSANEVYILTCTIYKSKKLEFLDLSATIYKFDIFDEDDIKRYIKSREWVGKAGACMVEGFCKKYIKEVKGFASCARGLSIEKLLPFMSHK